MSEMGEGDSGDEFFQKAPSPPRKMKRPPPTYSPSRDKVTYDYKFDLSSDEEEEKPKKVSKRKVGLKKSSPPLAEVEIARPAPFLQRALYNTPQDGPAPVPAPVPPVVPQSGGMNMMAGPQGGNMNFPGPIGPQNPNMGMGGSMNMPGMGMGMPNQMNMNPGMNMGMNPMGMMANNPMGMGGNMPNNMQSPMGMGMGMGGNMPNQMGMGNMPNQMGMQNMSNQMGMGGNMPGPMGMGGNMSNPMGMGMSGNMPGPMGMGGNMPGPMGMGGNMPGPMGMGGNMPGAMGMGGNMPGPMGMGGNIPGPMGMGGNMPGPMGMGGNMPGPMGMGGNMPGPMGMGGNMSNPMGMGGNMPGPMGMGGNMPGPMGMGGNMAGPMGMGGNMSGPMGMGGNMPGPMGMGGNMSGPMGMGGNMPGPMGMGMPNEMNSGPVGPMPNDRGGPRSRGPPASYTSRGHRSRFSPADPKLATRPRPSLNAFISKPPMLKGSGPDRTTSKVFKAAIDSAPPVTDPSLPSKKPDKKKEFDLVSTMKNPLPISTSLESPNTPSDPKEPNPFKNDGSFLEVFKKLKGPDDPEGDAVTEEKKEPEAAKKPQPKLLPSMVGKRRGGRVLKTGVVEKLKKLEPDEAVGPKDAWSLYMAEVKKYRETNCEEEGKTRALVK